MDVMDQTIILDCQTKSNTPSCESCIAYKQCRAKATAIDKSASDLEIGAIVSIESNETSIVS